MNHYQDKKSFNDVLRKRLIIELITSDTIIPYTKELLENYLRGLSEVLKMTIIMGPQVHHWVKDLNPEYYDGFEAIVMWAESGTQVYTWERFKAVTIDIYTCKDFSIEQALEYTKDVFKPEKIAWKEIEPILKL